jgi:hypothetical protein
MNPNRGPISVFSFTRELAKEELRAWSNLALHRLPELRATIVDIQDVMAASVASSLQAVRKKYATAKYGEVTSVAIAPLE